MTPFPSEPDGAGEPDGTERLYTPHRMDYIAAPKEQAGAGTASCPFCRIPTGNDADGLVVARGELVYAVLNLYPYNTGHLMVLPYRHIPDFTDATDAEATEMTTFTRHAMLTVRAAMGPDGFNIGINAGAVAGAGIAAHLHQHVVPRWSGDANFMPVIGRTTVLPQLLADTRHQLAEAW